MISICSINVRTCIHTCVHAYRACVRAFRSRFDASRALRDVDSRYGKYYIRGRPRKRRPFPNADCDCRTCVDSDLEVRLPGRTSRPLSSLLREKIVLLPFSDILESCACEKDERTALGRVIKFNFESREDAESTFSRKFTPFARRHPKVAKFILFVRTSCSLACYFFQNSLKLSFTTYFFIFR